jgi:hypothetical protein
VHHNYKPYTIVHLISLGCPDVRYCKMWVFRFRISVKGFETAESFKQKLSQLLKGFECFNANFARHLMKRHHLIKCLRWPADPRTPSSFAQIHVTHDQLHPDFAYFTSCCHESTYSTNQTCFQPLQTLITWNAGYFVTITPSASLKEFLQNSFKKSDLLIPNGIPHFVKCTLCTAYGLLNSWCCDIDATNVDIATCRPPSKGPCFYCPGRVTGNRCGNRVKQGSMGVEAWHSTRHARKRAGNSREPQGKA